MTGDGDVVRGLQKVHPCCFCGCHAPQGRTKRSFDAHPDFHMHLLAVIGPLKLVHENDQIWSTR